MPYETPITQEALSAYRRAFALHKAHTPGDPFAREAHQRATFDVNEALRIALDRNPYRVPSGNVGERWRSILCQCRGPAFTDDWKCAISIRHELDQLIRELA